MTPLFRKFLGLNWFLFLIMIGVLIFGVFAVYSATYMREGAMALTFRRQMTFILLGLVIFFVVALTDYRWIRWAALPSYLGGLVLLIALRFFGETRGGATSWIDLGPITFQPSQVALVGGIMVLAVALAELQRLHPVFENHLLKMAISGILAAIPVVLILKEPDLGSASVWAPMVAAMLLVASIPLRYLIVIGQILLIALPLVYWFGLKPHQMDRIDVYLAPFTGAEIDTLGAGYDTNNVMIAVATGGIDGKGFKGRRMKSIDPSKKTVTEMAFVTPAHMINDFIFMVIAEQLGFRGSSVLIVALACMLLLCLVSAFCSRDQMGRLLVVAISAVFFVHIFVNIGMCIQLVPVTGIPLPLISSGGTFICISMFLLGIVQSVWVHRGIQESLPERSLFYSLD